VAHALIGKPVSTSPERALARDNWSSSWSWAFPTSTNVRIVFTSRLRRSQGLTPPTSSGRLIAFNLKAVGN
jgi:hypothetical protein